MSLETISEFAHHHQLHKDIHYGKPYFAVLLAGFSSLAGWFLGYDQGVTGGVVVMSSFKNDFCVGVYANASVCDLPVTALPPGYRRFLVLFTLLYNVGCFLGALFISSFVAEKFGRRAIIFTSAVLFLIGTSIVIFPPGGSKKIMILILIGRIVEDHGVDIPPGYTRMNFRCMGKTVYCSPFATRAMASIVEDRTQHNGGVWKAGPRKTWAEQGCPQELRSGTYDGSLTWIGDRRK